VYIWCSIPKDRTPEKRKILKRGKYSIRKTYGTVPLTKIVKMITHVYVRI
jgi:hypothetical protein